METEEEGAPSSRRSLSVSNPFVDDRTSLLSNNKHDDDPSFSPASVIVVGSDEDNLPTPVSNSFPPSIKYIMGNEACERFSFYGLKAILALYLKNYLLFSEDRATFIIHAFIFSAYTTALLGGYIADSWLGKYRTILYISFVYCTGSLTLSLTALPGATGDPPHWWGAALGLVLVALGTGGIKACVSSFVGDQFVKGQEHMLTAVFSLFYFMINVGSLMSTIITPLLREYTTYSIAFGVPAGLLLVATFIFWFGSSTYVKIPAGKSVINSLFGVVWKAFRGVYRARRDGTYSKERQFLDYASDEYSPQLIKDVRAVLSVFKVFIPLPIFWSLFDQHSSRWVFQADHMDRELFLGLKVEPDQALIPVFNKAVYPLLEKIGLPLKPLSRMTIGMLFTVTAFVASGLIQLWMDEEYLHVAWQLPQYFLLACGEIMVSITGLELAYSQAPKSMKSVVMAGWLLTTAIGNLVVAGIAEVSLFSDQAIEFFFYAGLMGVFTVLFLLFVRKYQYVNQYETDEDSNVKDN